MGIALSEQAGQLIIKTGFGIILAFIAWTVVASFVFLLGTGLLHEFPRPFWQWWLYALNFDGNPRVALWLKIGAAVGIMPPVGMMAGLIYRGQRVVGPKLRRPLFGGIVNSPLAVTDNHGRAAWMGMAAARERFPGPNPVFGGIVVGEAYRVDRDKVAVRRFDPEDPKSWGQGGQAPLLIDPCREGPTHSLMIIGSGGYKTTTAVSTLLHWAGSAVILDPAGEIAPMLRDARKAMGQAVYELDPCAGAGFNVLDWIETTSPLAATNIDSVVAWVCGDHKPAAKKDDFFDSMARNVVRCLLAHILFDQTAPVKLKTLRAVRRAIAMPANEVRAVLRGIFEASPSAYARQLAGPVCGLVDETFSGVIGSAAELTTWLANPAFADLVSGNSFKTFVLLDGKVTIFLKMPLKALETEPGISRTIIGALLNAVYEADGAMQGRVLFLLDEAARLGYMKILETARDAGRKYGITMQLLYQSSGQIVEQWGEQGKRSWYDGVSYRCYAAVQDLDTATELENSFGTYGVMASSEGMNTGKSGKAMQSSSLSRGSNVSYHEIGRPLIRKAELMRGVRDDEMFVLARGMAPLRCGRAIYFRRPEMQALVAENRFHKPGSQTVPGQRSNHEGA
ncbi:type IV secretory system conjugative DNA transfer family protein [Acidiphilium sp. AL]|uniref:Type IV secretory system conjugative DNA transfer family protein n=1 Tax=Acidiphilium iwatense TaxID=768198 RepID=A0ABS9E075_9PROT|nr:MULTISPECIES: type IV secretory system conjugative DNA transfer family protein [Acidiphilium]MCF3948413.1 type IV secretory system conjugative DNA transfer family protein [Acidiphilium iwatense]MCU4161646.1 type IV secretory system conjugative DNA transfer family protein [Acidiphilium sp. AL]